MKKWFVLSMSVLILIVLFVIRSIIPNTVPSGAVRLTLYSAVLLGVFCFFYHQLWDIFSRKRDIPAFIIAWLVGFLFIQPIHQNIIGIDTLSIYEATHGVVESESSTGRVFGGLTCDMQITFGLLRESMMPLVYLFVMTFLTAAVIRLRTLLDSLRDTDEPSFLQDQMILAGLLLAVYNPFSLEWITFTNVPGFYIDAAAVVLAVDSLLRYPLRKGIWIGLCLLILPCNGYQSMAALFILLAIPLMFVNLDRTGKVSPVKNLILSILIPGAVSCIALGSSALWILAHRAFYGMIQPRVTRGIDFLENLRCLKTGLPDLLKYSYDLLPPYLLAAVMAVLLVLILAGYKKMRFPFWQTCLILAASLTGCIGFSILFQLFIPEPLFAARSVFAFSAIPGMLMVFFVLYRRSAPCSVRGHAAEYAALLVCLLLLGTVLHEAFRLSAALKEVFRRDSIEAAQVIRRIEQLEKQHGAQIRQVRMFHDYPYQETYPGIKYKGFASRLLAVPWKFSPFMKKYHHREFTVEKVYNFEAFRAVYGNQQWDGPDFEKQIILKDGVICIAAY